MKRAIPFALLLAAALVAPQIPAQPQAQQPTIAHTNLKVGDVAPDFTMRDQAFKPVKLSDFRGKKDVILAFYVLAFTGG